MILIAITGATGFEIATKILEILKNLKIKTELIISNAAKIVFKNEIGRDITEVYDLVSNYYDIDDIAAAPASGSYKIDTMIIVPCTMKTLSAIANGFASNLITRAADVMIKERRRLVLVTRESPLNAIHLENMLKLARLGVVIAPPVPSYYIQPHSVNDLTTHLAGRILDQVGIDSGIKRWGAD
ncbi:MAG: UbiX family flavin prenyltransferase [Promethearchaeota archaeon]